MTNVSCGFFCRENWEVSRRDMHDPHFMAMLSRNQNFMESDFEDYAIPSPRSLLCGRIVALTVMLLSLSLSSLSLSKFSEGIYRNSSHPVSTEKAFLE